jgi:hypothetical protein
MSESYRLSRPLIFVLIAIALLALAARIIPQPRTIDDAYITFRYSRNIVDGEGFVYNPDTRTLGTTTPFYTLLMAAIGFITGSENYPWFALIVNALADAGTCVLLGLIIHRVTEQISLAAILGVIWALHPLSVTFAIGGMETSVVILWSVAATYFYFTKHNRTAAVFAALGILTRIDALIWVGPLMAHQLYTNWRSKHRAPWRSWLIFTAILLPWFLFSWFYFGTILSRSLSAKQVAYIVPEFHALTRLLQNIATPFFEHELIGIPAIIIGVLLYPELAAIGILRVSKQQPRLLPFLMYPWLYLIAFSIMNPVIFRWYLSPMMPAYLLSILIGLWVVSNGIASRLKQARALPVGFSAVGILLVGILLNAWTLHPDHGPDRPAPTMAWHQIELYYQQVGEALRRDCGITEDTVVAAGDIGAVGYYSRAHILDTVGLVTPEISNYYPLDPDLPIEGSNYAVPPAIIYDYKPDYIVFMEMFVRNGLAKESWFTDQYPEIAMIPTDFYGTGMIVYEHQTDHLCQPDISATQ